MTPLSSVENLASWDEHVYDIQWCELYPGTLVCMFSQFSLYQTNRYYRYVYRLYCSVP